ncbi:acetoacetyl-CoA synthetase-like [Clavelina lepadiformis]|uniref:acetoacetyl-CoA synthetase-like n=1 Tax=Clavelina lepadiformis TaxID=159417 RepID=UPI004042931A
MPSNDEDVACCGLQPKVMWTPGKLDTKMTEFMKQVNKSHYLQIETYRELWKWSVENYSDFWKEFWKYCHIKCSKDYDMVVDTSKSITDNPEWFAGAKMNYAENMMRYCDDHVALIGAGEGQEIKKVTYAELHARVAKYASALRNVGVKAGDRVVGYIPNCIEAVEAMLATASIGAIWSSTSPDFGVTGVLDRFQQIKPKVIFSVEAVWYNNKVHVHLDKLRQVACGLPDLEHVIVIPFVSKELHNHELNSIPNSLTLSSFLENEASLETLSFEQLPFNHPLFVMYSSGTTGPPKCMVHSAGGTLLQHMKEHILHGNMDRHDCILYYTTTGWMMWNWMVGALAAGATLVLYDGSPFHPKPTILWDIIDSLGVTTFGTSAKCLDVMQEKGLEPKETHSLKQLHTILSTGSPLAPHQYDYVYEHIKPDLLLGSITGGTDIVSCFMGQNWNIPVYRGELQSANLGMAVCCYNEDENGNGKPVYNSPGELVCTKPFPCMPIYFWNDEDGILYKKAYFSKFPDVWSHGDFCLENKQTHGFVMMGRSDATLNPNGVRFGTSEIYKIMESQFRNEVIDSLAAAQRPSLKEKEKYLAVAASERVILFLQMAPGFSLDKDLEQKIRKTIRTQLSPRHVPAVILEIKDIPYTISGKKVEIAVTRILAGLEIKHASAFRNPECLKLYQNIAILQNF